MEKKEVHAGWILSTTTLMLLFTALVTVVFSRRTDVHILSLIVAASALVIVFASFLFEEYVWDLHTSACEKNAMFTKFVWSVFIVGLILIWVLQYYAQANLSIMLSLIGIDIFLGLCKFVDWSRIVNMFKNPRLMLE